MLITVILTFLCRLWEDFCPLNSPDLSTFISKYGAASLLEIMQDVDDLRQNQIDA